MNNMKATKKQLAILAVLLCTTANADESLCPVNTEIPKSIRINESDLTKEKAEAALKILGSIVSGENPNHQKTQGRSNSQHRSGVMLPDM